MAKKKVAKKKKAKKVKKVRKTKKVEIDSVSCERELRKYVKRDGGFCKDISNADKKRARQLLKLLSRKKLEWDKNIIQLRS